MIKRTVLPSAAVTHGVQKRLLDLLGMVLIGDGLLTLLNPKRHCLLWEIGPGPVRQLVDEFATHPTAARAVGLAEVLLGVAIAERQMTALLAWRRRFLP